MNGKPPIDADAQMIGAILADAEAQTTKIAEEARSTVDAELKSIEAEAKAVREEIVGRAKDKAQRLRARGQALAAVEARRIVLRARESAIQSILTQVKEQLAVLRLDDAAYRASLLFLAEEAVRGVSEPVVQLAVAKRDSHLLDSDFQFALKNGVSKSLGIGPDIRFAFDLADTAGGCVARSGDGRIVFDNTFTRRFERALRSLRAAILKEAPNCHE
ncbi:MAG: V-type proton ATPase subunit E [Candidatus Hydrogenedentes bacterium]|nr:V-type proton ATPase subunit E [Candidatus Hydrogenedentota bacterium]